MSSLWTPGGERPVPRQPAAEPQTQPSTPPPAGAAPGYGSELTEEEARAQMEEFTRQIAAAPPEVVIANHAYGIFELAAVHLSVSPPQLEQARLAIDALGALVEGLGDRLGEPAADLQAALAQLRMGFVQVSAAFRSEGAEAAGDEA